MLQTANTLLLLGGRERERQTHRQTYRRTDGQTNRQTHRHTDRLTDRQTDRDVGDKKLSVQEKNTAGKKNTIDTILRRENQMKRR